VCRPTEGDARVGGSPREIFELSVNGGLHATETRAGERHGPVRGKAVSYHKSSVAMVILVSLTRPAAGYGGKRRLVHMHLKKIFERLD